MKKLLARAMFGGEKDHVKFIQDNLFTIWVIVRIREAWRWIRYPKEVK